MLVTSSLSYGAFHVPCMFFASKGLHRWMIAWDLFVIWSVLTSTDLCNGSQHPVQQSSRTVVPDHFSKLPTSSRLPRSRDQPQTWAHNFQNFSTSVPCCNASSLAGLRYGRDLARSLRSSSRSLKHATLDVPLSWTLAFLYSFSRLRHLSVHMVGVRSYPRSFIFWEICSHRCLLLLDVLNILSISLRYAINALISSCTHVSALFLGALIWSWSSLVASGAGTRSTWCAAVASCCCCCEAEEGSCGRWCHNNKYIFCHYMSISSILSLSL